jgi:hypothetical protein
MSRDWTLLCRLTDPVEAGILRGVLETNGIPVTLLDRRDSSYPAVFPGEIEVYVPPIWLNLAAELMSRALMN